MQGRLVHPGRLSGMPWGSFGSSGSFGSLGCALAVVAFIRSIWVHSGAPWGSLGSYRVVWFTPVRLWVRLGSALGALPSCGSLSSSEVVGFTRLRHGGRSVHLGSLGSLSCALVIVGFIEFTRVRPDGR